MKAEELRVGNLVRWSEKYNTPIIINYRREIHKFEIRDFKFISYFDPIEITEDNLSKLGFNNVLVSYELYVDDIIINIEKSCGQFNVYINKAFIRYIEYIHELQNLYYALTKKELDIKL